MKINFFLKIGDQINSNKRFGTKTTIEENVDQTVYFSLCGSVYSFFFPLWCGVSKGMGPWPVSPAPMKTRQSHGVGKSVILYVPVASGGWGSLREWGVVPPTSVLRHTEEGERLTVKLPARRLVMCTFVG